MCAILHRNGPRARYDEIVRKRWVVGLVLVTSLGLCAPRPADADGAARVARHYLWSNERRHDLFFDDLRSLGGGYIGVGADQNYSLAAAARADRVWLVDLDAEVIYLHHLYLALVARAPTAAEFLRLLGSAREPQVAAALVARGLDERQQQGALEIFRAHQTLLRRKLERTASYFPGGAAANWLNDPALYQHLRQLVESGRIVARLGDLNGPRTMQQIGEEAERDEVPVRVLYLSNAESWFRYNSRFVRNLSALPIDERSVVLRTVKSDVLGYPAGDVWHFSVQRADDFRMKLSGRGYDRIEDIMADVLPDGGAVDPGSGRLPGERRRGLSHIAPGPGVLQAATSRRGRAPEGLVTRPAGIGGVQ